MNLVGDELNIWPSVSGTAHSLNTFGYYCCMPVDRGGEGTLKTTDLSLEWGFYVVQTALMLHTLTTQHMIWLLHDCTRLHSDKILPSTLVMLKNLGISTHNVCSQWLISAFHSWIQILPRGFEINVLMTNHCAFLRQQIWLWGPFYAKSSGSVNFNSIAL